ncbi:DUF3108 domain-containing protein [Candidatus Poribacteria bacterium]|nr:DUF3108 domain-containing protein [Candidatus Poribacteria bacterium]
MIPRQRRPTYRGHARVAWAAVCLVVLAHVGGLRADSPVLTDPGIAQNEHSVYRLTKHSGAVSTSTHHVTTTTQGSTRVYSVTTDNSTMILRTSDMTPMTITKRGSGGAVETEIRYSSDRVNFIYPGPTRNRVEKVDENRYDVNAIVYAVRALPATGRDRVEVTLVTEEHILGVYFEEQGRETIRTPAGSFPCVQYEAGLTGLKGRVFKKKIRFWVEQSKPYRLIRQEDEGVSDTRLLELQSYSIGGSR